MNKLIKYILKSRNQKEIAHLLKTNRHDLLFVSKETGQTLSHLAVYSGNDKLVYELVNQKMFIDQPDYQGFYPFMYTFMYYRDFLEKIMPVSQKKFEYTKIMSISRILTSAGYNTYYTGMNLKDTSILLSKMLNYNYSYMLLQSSKIIESKYGDDGSNLSHLAVKFGYVDVLNAILEAKNFQCKELFETTNHKKQNVYDLSRIYTPYLMSYLNTNKIEWINSYYNIKSNAENYNIKKAALFTFIDKHIDKGVEKIFKEGIIKPHNAHAVLSLNKHYEEVPFIAYIINKNNINAFDIAMRYIENTSEAFYENNILKTIYTKAEEKDLENKQRTFRDLFESYNFSNKTSLI